MKKMKKAVFTLAAFIAMTGMVLVTGCDKKGGGTGGGTGGTTSGTSGGTSVAPRVVPAVAALGDDLSERYRNQRGGWWRRWQHGRCDQQPEHYDGADGYR